MSSCPLKSSLIKHIQVKLEKKIEALDIQIKATESAQQNDTKSSAGDKFETGREMLQAELNKYENQRANIQASLKTLRSISLDKTSKSVEFGSLVETNNGIYFIALGLGKMIVEGSTIYAISLASPIGQVLHQAKVGDVLTFQGREMEIERII